MSPPNPHAASQNPAAEPHADPLTVTLPAYAYAGAGEGWRSGPEAVAAEEPLELSVLTPDGPRPLAVLMRTPGQDHELLQGWLRAEGLWTPDLALAPHPEQPNLWHLRAPDPAGLLAHARLGLSTSACGVCGVGRIERLACRAPLPRWDAPALEAGLLASLPAALEGAQPGYHRSGGLHGAGLFTAQGERLAVFEDVGRHNAVDKVLGWAWMTGALPADRILVVSSRAGFEVVQKAVASGVAVVVTVGAATSLAVQTAQSFGLTLAAFARQGRLTVYSGPERVVPSRL